MSEIIKYGGNGISNGSNGSNPSNQIVKYDPAKPVDYYSVKNAFQAMIIAKTMECNEYITSLFSITNPLAKMTLAFALLNPFQAWTLTKSGLGFGLQYGGWLKRFVVAKLYFKPTPVKKTFEVCYINENLINHLYIAFDWFLKTNSKKKIDKNYTVMILTKPIEASKKEKEFEIQKTVPEEQETEFEYNSHTFYYSKTSFDDIIYAPSGELKKKNHKLLIWTYDCADNLIFDNLTQYVINLYAKSKVDDVWVQKIFTHENGMWKDTVLERNKRKISTVVMKDSRNLEIGKLLTHFNESEEWHVERGIPYKKSFLFYGPPGTGKSSMIRAISAELQRHIHFLNLSVIKNDLELVNLMGKINFKETILVIEDIDAQGKVTHKRSKEFADQNAQPQQANQQNQTNQLNSDQPNLINPINLIQLVNSSNPLTQQSNSQTQAPTLTLSCLLNQLDGVNNNHGMITILTTNFPEILDEALIRDGRVDERVFFDYVDYDVIHKMFVNFFNGKNEVTLDLIKEKIDLSKKISPSAVENSMRRCYSNSLEALDNLVESAANKKMFEKFEI